MNDPSVRTTKLDCFACGNPFETKSPAGSTAFCPECGVPQTVPGRALGSPKSPPPSPRPMRNPNAPPLAPSSPKPLNAPTMSMGVRRPAPPIPIPVPIPHRPRPGGSLAAGIVIGLLIGFLLMGFAGYVLRDELRQKWAAIMQSRGLATNDDVTETPRPVEVARRPELPQADASQPVPPEPEPEPEPEPSPEIRRPVEVAERPEPPGPDASRRVPPRPRREPEPEPRRLPNVFELEESPRRPAPDPPRPRRIPEPQPRNAVPAPGLRTRPEPDRVAATMRTPATFRYPRTADEIRSTLSGILGEPDQPGMATEVCDALRRLKAYRFLAGLPYRDISLDANYNKGCIAAADICRRLGYLTHTPKNPDLPEDEYERARVAAGKSNLAFYHPERSVAASIDMWMEDSDPSNIDRLGHRRWCLNPSMRKTGFGRSGEFSAMWVAEDEIKPFEDYQFVSHPAAGLMPTDYFGARYAWSLTLNPRKFQVPSQEEITVRVYPVKGGDIDRDKPMKLDYFAVETGWFGVPNCIIFRPLPVEVANGRRYWVEVKGLRGSDGAPTELSYLVEFFH
jgi:hypothetical protein